MHSVLTLIVLKLFLRIHCRYEFSLQQIYSITQDNGRNFVLAGKMLSYEKFQLSSENNESSSQNCGSGESDSEDELILSSSSTDPDRSSNNNDGDGTSDDDETYVVDDRCFDDDTEHEYVDEEVQYNLIDAENVDEIGGIEVIRCAAHTLALGVNDTVTKLKSKSMFKKFRKLSKLLRTPSQLVNSNEKIFPYRNST